MSINALVKINGTEVTEHNRRITINNTYDNTDMQLSSGSTRRFYKPSKRVFTFNWSYLPNKAEKTVDLRVGRDFIHSLITSGSLVTLLIQEYAKDNWEEYTCIVSSYNEDMLKNVLQSQCRYYDVNLIMEEL
jgi:hypothetical protein